MREWRQLGKKKWQWPREHGSQLKDGRITVCGLKEGGAGQELRAAVKGEEKAK